MKIFRKLLSLLNGPRPLPSRFGIAQCIFTRGLGLIYLIAILSWWVQLDGLVGSNGIVPAAGYFDWVNGQGDGSFWRAPSVFLWNASDAAMHWTCLTGVVIALLIIAGILQGPLLLVLWFLYLSLVTSGNVFMSFQWDILLLETGLLAVFFAPWRLWVPPRRIFPRASRWMVFLLWFLLFKLMFFSGILKIANDESWRDGTALTYHYETQPIPHAVAWYAHRLPDWFQVASSWVMIVIECGLPFLIFLGRRPRLLAGAGFVFLMLAIMATGNFTYFNHLTILLCIPLLDDSLWPRGIRNAFKDHHPGDLRFPRLFQTRVWFGRGVRIVAGGFLFMLSLYVCQQQLIREARWIQSPFLPLSQSVIAPAHRFFSPFHSVSGYGLFRVMTKERPEIIIEGSHDGQTWIPYDHRWKPDELDEAPKLVAPHQPRLDWQMWFAALGARYQRSYRTVWFENLMGRMLEGEPEVLRLFAANPFPEKPPRYVRARLYDYRFTSAAEKAETGNWWKREELGEFFPAVSRR